jgi:hypothetical protein
MTATYEKREAPVSWEVLLDEAINKPGTLSACYSVFHNFSLGNQLLAYWQLRARGLEAGALATFKGWKAKGRAVMRGQKGITLCMPIVAKKTDKDGNDKRVAFFVYKALWFAFSQTEAIPGVEDTFQAEAAPEGWDRDLALRSLGIDEKPYGMVDGNCQGYASARSVSVNPCAAHPVKTLIHEIAHIVLGHTGQNDWNPGHTAESRSLREVEAESVALILGEVLGLGTADESRGYIQHWNSLHGGQRIPERSAQAIFSAAHKILSAGRAKVQEEVEAG